MIDWALITAITGVVLGLLGFGLGILNTWHAFERDRVRIKVEPWVYPTIDGGKCIGISIYNLSLFPITIKDAGFTFEGNGKNFDISASLNPDNKFPNRMKPFTDFTVRMGPLKGDRWLKVCTAFADTAHGDRITKMPRRLKKEIRAIALTKPNLLSTEEILKRYIKTEE